MVSLQIRVARIPKLRLPVPHRSNSIDLKQVPPRALSSAKHPLLREPMPRHVAVIMDGNRRWGLPVGSGLGP
ncbi:hypothetical protein SASPL_101998 [Salvia splendens]|uniref:Uncharacterized protein n=1 Tax=Salvia splendens TaxID=180675 RepID=A0A8X8YRT3_SALSN|nr:hypothetical protein SASPL_101998 [Salvia splendens]